MLPHRNCNQIITFYNSMFVIDEQRFLWRGELCAGSYLLLPFTTGCRLMKRTRKTSTTTAQLVNRTQSGELELTKEFKLVNSNL